MFSMIVLRRLRPCVSHLSVSTGQFPVGRHPVPVSVSCFSGVSGNQLTLHAVKRSFPVINKRVQFHHQSPRCLSTTPPSEHGNLIYTGNMGAAVRGLKLFSYCISGVNLVILSQILQKIGFVVQSVDVQVTFCGGAFFSFLNPIVFHFLTKSYVLRLYHDQDRNIYTAITSGIFITDRKTVFHQSQVQVPAISKLFTTFYAGQDRLLVNPDLFPVPDDYNRLIGYSRGR